MRVTNIKSNLMNTILIILVGVALGIFSKLLDNMPLYDDAYWHRILEILDLGNVFSRLSIWVLLAVIISVNSKGPLRASVNVFGFFVGMLAGYYMITIYVSGFFPKSYMIAWGIITLFTPFLAYLIWYSKGSGLIAIPLSSIIIGFFITQAFSFGMYYIDLSYYDGVICLLLAILVLYKDNKQLVLSIIGAIIVAPFIKVIIPYIFGGL
ncbi:MAG: hypothetical protein GX363_04820 [Clostridiales bacterium]|jgi:hypothetical protein|nr:hypothetical protein [Clostridiales bacterium]